MSGLASDPRRQAQDSIRGYVYQILRSVLVWLDLGDEEELYLEGAEDLDRISPTGAVTEQVKDTAGSGAVTLRTVAVAEAINHFWEHRARNPGVAIAFSYVTTSTLGVEAGAPFGPSISGLALWGQTGAREDALEAARSSRAIADFLQDQHSISDPLKRFLREASDAEILDTLIRPVRWLAGQQETSGLAQQIKDRLVKIGQSLGVAAGDAELAFEALYVAAFDAATRKDNAPLTRAGALRIFAASTTIQVPKKDLLALLQSAIAASPQGLITSRGPPGVEGAPPLPRQYYRRLAEEQRLRTALRDGAVLLHGGTGTGKTLTVASALAGEAAAWITLRDLNPGETKARLEAARQAIAAGASAQVVVVDDINALADPRPFEAALGALWSCVKAMGGRLIATSDRTLAARLAQALELETPRELQVRPFNAAEIEGFLLECGCPQERAPGWAKVLELATLGHPQLIHARIATLAGEAFPPPAASDLLLSVPEENRVRLEAHRLINDLPDGPRELLFRASLMTGLMGRPRLMAIARLRGAIAEPGAAIDTIAGPWLEATGDGQFRVSPLARGAAEHARGADWAKAMHGQLAWIYLQDRKITHWEISTIVMHCYLGGTAGPLVHVLRASLGADEAVWSAISDTCGVYASLGVDSGQLPFERLADLFVFRIFQYRTAAVSTPDLAKRIAAKIDGEFKAAPDDEITRYFRFLYLSQLLGALSVSYPMSLIVERVCEFINVAQAVEADMPGQLAAQADKVGIVLQDNRYTQFGGIRLVGYVKTIDDLEALTVALQARSPDEARTLLSSVVTPDNMLSVLVDTVWLDNFSQTRQPWPVFRDRLGALADLAIAVGIPEAARAIAPTLIRVINEDIDDPVAALAAAEHLEAVAGEDPIFRCALAKIVARNGQSARALKIWREALPRWPDPANDIGCSFAYRAAAMAAGKHGDWAAAAEFLSTGAALVAECEKRTYAIGFQMDAAYCQFMAGNRTRGVAGFHAVVKALEPLQGQVAAEPQLSLQRRVGSILAMIANRLDNMSEDERAQIVATCSNLDALKSDAPLPPPLDSLRRDLLTIELTYGGSLDAMAETADTLRRTPLASMRATSASPLFALAQRTLDFGPAMADGLRQLDALAMMTEQRANHDQDVLRAHDGVARPWPQGADELLVGSLVLAVFDLAAADRLDDLPLNRWRDDAEAHPEAGRINRLVGHIEGLFVTATVGPWATVLSGGSGDWAEHALAALAATLLESLAPDSLLQAHALWASYLRQPHLKALSASACEQLVSAAWEPISRMRSRDAAQDAALTEMRSALDESYSGWLKVKAILTAAATLVALSPSDHAWLVIRDIAD